jgi:hypothetical protein
MAILCAFWYIFPVLVCCAKKNLATLLDTETRLFIEKFLFQALPPKVIFYQDFFESFFSNALVLRVLSRLFCYN